MSRFSFLILSLFVSMDLGSLPHDWVREGGGGGGGWDCCSRLLACRAESAQNTLLNLDWWTSRYRLGYAMGGGMAGEDLGKQCLWNIGLRSVENHLLMGM